MQVKANHFALSCGTCALALLLHQPLQAQSPANPQDPTAPASSQQAVAPGDTMQPTSQPGVLPTEGKLSRWLDLNTLSFSFRYRSTTDADGYHLFQYGQQRSLIDGKLKLDAEGKYGINFHVSSGKYFNWAYASEIGGTFAQSAPMSVTRFPLPRLIAAGQAIANDPFYQFTSAHIADRGWEMYVRQLYFTASPIKQLTFEYGSMPIEHAVNTEMTTYDDDGYMAGGRVRLKDPDHLFFDQIAATFGYVGDIYYPSVFDRGNRFAQSNYHQFLLEKKLGGRLDASVDWTEHLHTHTMREAALVNTRESHVLDSLRLELYQRTNDITLQGETFAGGNGFGVTAAKEIAKKWRVEGGYASIDPYDSVYIGSRFMVVVGHSINGDAYAVGNRFFGRAAYKPNPYLTFFGYYTHIVNTDFMTLNRETVYGGAEVNLKNALNSAFHLF